VSKRGVKAGDDPRRFIVGPDLFPPIIIEQVASIKLSLLLKIQK
jgi:hypothetical protein